MMGGCQGYTRFNDVWSSEDGSHWTRLTADAGWSKRCCFPAVVIDGALVISGGHDEADYTNDGWRSEDGVRWSRLTASAPWGVRDGHAAVVLGSALVIIGGHDGRSDERQWHQDVWQSIDGGSNWMQLTAAAEFPPRDGAFATVVNGTVVLLGGFAGDAFRSDVWHSRDGRHWVRASPALAGWSGRAFFGGGRLPPKSGGRLLVFAGWQATGEVVNDVWLGEILALAPSPTDDT